MSNWNQRFDLKPYTLFGFDYWLFVKSLVLCAEIYVIRLNWLEREKKTSITKAKRELLMNAVFVFFVEILEQYNILAAKWNTMFEYKSVFLEVGFY